MNDSIHFFLSFINNLELNKPSASVGGGKRRLKKFFLKEFKIASCIFKILAYNSFLSLRDSGDEKQKVN